jgi:hypothetical protein
MIRDFLKRHEAAVIVGAYILATLCLMAPSAFFVATSS